MDTDASAARAALKELTEAAKLARKTIYEAVANDPRASAEMSFRVGLSLGSLGNTINRADALLAVAGPEPSTDDESEPDANAGL